jgi:mitochondrial GTPase 1
MKSMVAQIDLVIECRDYRTPLVSRNPLFEQTLGERPRLIVYTKQDLGSNYTAADRRVWIAVHS